MGRMLTLNPEERITAKEVKHRVITAEHGVITMRRRVIAMQALAHEYFTEAPPPKGAAPSRTLAVGGPATPLTPWSP